MTEHTTPGLEKAAVNDRLWALPARRDMGPDTETD